jgi:hypothetical protein
VNSRGLPILTGPTVSSGEFMRRSNPSIRSVRASEFDHPASRRRRLLLCAAHIAIAAAAERTPTTSPFDHRHENHDKPPLGIPPDSVTLDNALMAGDCF